MYGVRKPGIVSRITLRSRALVPFSSQVVGSVSTTFTMTPHLVGGVAATHFTRRVGDHLHDALARTRRVAVLAFYPIDLGLNRTVLRVAAEPRRTADARSVLRLELIFRECLQLDHCTRRRRPAQRLVRLEPRGRRRIATTRHAVPRADRLLGNFPLLSVGARHRRRRGARDRNPGRAGLGSNHALSKPGCAAPRPGGVLIGFPLYLHSPFANGRRAAARLA